MNDETKRHGTSPRRIIALVVAALLCVGAVILGVRYGSPIPADPSSPGAAPPPSTEAGSYERVELSTRRRLGIAERRPDILLFTMDTARADHLSAYGYERDTTPRLRALAERGVRFERAYATSSWTAPSVASMLTGVTPSEHGIARETFTRSFRVHQVVLPPELPSLAEGLREAGYRTVAVTANNHLTANLGFARGFDHFENVAFNDLDVLREALEPHLEPLRESEAPFFLWVHVLDPHAPYVAHEQAMEVFWPSPRARYPDLLEPVIVESFAFTLANDATTERFDYVVAAYDSELHHVDRFLGSLLDKFESRHLAVVVSADHGEEFRDHGGFGHGHTMYDESIRVPLVIALPDSPGGGRQVETPVSGIDLLPTLLSLGGAPRPARAQGRSLLAALAGEPLEDLPVVAETARHECVAAIIMWPYKYSERTIGASSPELYDLSRDPLEQRNLVQVEASQARRMRQALRESLATAGTRQPILKGSDVSLPTLEQLRALGYVR